MNGKSSLGLIALAWQTTAQAQLPEGKVKLERLELREFVPETGEWRKLILSEPDRFDGTAIGWRSFAWGGADLEILVPVTGQPETETGEPLSIIVKSLDTGKVVIRRRYTGVQIGTTGRSYQSVVFREAACDGNLEATATLGRQTQRLKLDLECHE